MTETTVLIRLGRVIYWTGCGFALLSITASLIYAGMLLAPALESVDPEDPFANLWVEKSASDIAGPPLLLGLGTAVAVWLIGKAARYVLANE
jgi:hypothetical protein